MTIRRRLAALGAAGALALLGAVAFAGTAGAVDGTMTVDPSTIVAGESTTVSGTGCTYLREVPSEVDIAVDAVGTEAGTPVATAVANPDGNGAWSVAVAVKEPGSYTVRATCDQYLGEASDYPEQPLTVTEAPPSSSESPSSESPSSESPSSESPSSESPSSESPSSESPSSESPSSESPSSESPTSESSTTAPELTLVNYTGQIEQGGSMGIDATGFQPGENVTVTLHSDPVLLTTLIADDGGRASGTVTIPLDTAVGAHTITVVGELSGVSLEAPIAVVAAVETTVSQPPTTGSSPPAAVVTSTAEPAVVTSTSDLANTGVNAAAMTIWGVVLLAAGGIAVALARKRDGKHVRD